MRAKRYLWCKKLFVLAMIFPISAELIHVGKGGYNTTLPAGAQGPINSSGAPVIPKVDSTFSQVPTTNDWWSSVIWQYSPTNPWSENLFAHPLSCKAFAGGLEIGHPRQLALTPDIQLAKGHKVQEYHYYHVKDLGIGVVGLTSPDTRVLNYSDWAVSAIWKNGSRSLTATIGHGLPFVYCTKTGDNAHIACYAMPTIWYNQNGVLGLTVNGRHYGVFGPAGSVWTGTTMLQSTLTGKDYFSVAVLPDNTPATLEFYRKHAYAFVTDTKVSWVYNEANAQVITTFNVTTQLKESGNGNVNQPLLALFRHQWLNSNVPTTSYTYPSARGLMKVAEASSFTTNLTFNGVLPELPLVSIDGQDSFSHDQLYNYVDTIFNQTTLARWGNLNPGDTYWAGKAMGRIARLIHIAHFVGHTQARDLFLAEAKQRVSDWLDGQGPAFYYYDNVWKTLIGFPASYGSDTQLNDHHFHWAYLIILAATIAQYDATWSLPSEWGGMVELLIKDVANWDKTDLRFPFIRMYDLYAGHGWANGAALFAAGNNQESSSESMNFSTAVILWGSMTNNKAVRDLGIYLYATERSAIEQYWFDIDDAVFPAGFTKPTLGILWGDGGAYAIWWDGYVEELHGINFLPITGGSLYLGRNPDYLKLNQDFMASNGGGNNSWRDIHMEVMALYDPQKAIALFNTQPFATEAGESRAHTYHWIHALNSLGRLDTTISANSPLAAVFIKNNVRTYVGYNPTDSAQTIHFSNGALLNVQPHTVGFGDGSDQNPEPDPETPVQPLEYRIDLLEEVGGNITIRFVPSQTCQEVDLYYTFTTESTIHKQSLTQTAQGWQTSVNNVPVKAQMDYYLVYKQQGTSLSTGWFRFIYANECQVCTPDNGGGTTPPPSDVIDEGDFTRQVQLSADNKATIIFTPKTSATFVDIHYIVNAGGQLNYRMGNTNGVWSHTVGATLNSGDKIRYFFTYDKNGPAYDSAWYEYVRP